MLSENSVKEVRALLLDTDEETLTADRKLEEIEGWDSVNALRVLVYLEREAGGRIDYDRFMSAKRVGELWSDVGAQPVQGAAS
ncbi:MAG: acyl carrier protein [Myxococcaceae bacterium]|nr:acyl carrier protein [Myxococcaceae bacterium]